MKRRTRWLLAFFPTGLAETVVSILVVIFLLMYVLRISFVTIILLYKHEHRQHNAKCLLSTLTSYPRESPAC